MKQSRTFFIGFGTGILLVIVAFGAFFAWQRSDRFKYNFVTPRTFEQCRAAGGVILESYPEQCRHNGLTFINNPYTPDRAASSPPLDNQWQKYHDTRLGIEFIYPSNLLLSPTKVQLPLFNTETVVQATALTHTVPIKYCGLSALPEHCTPTTTDIQISFAWIELPIEQVKKSKIGPLELVRIGEYDSWVSFQGAEGEGINYYFISGNQDKTLMITQKYLDETVLSQYQSVPGFISYAQQKIIFQKTIDSLNTSAPMFPTKTTPWSLYANQNYNFSFSYPSDWKLGTYKAAANSQLGITHVAIDPKQVGSEQKYRNHDSVMGMITFTMSEDGAEDYSNDQLANTEIGAERVVAYKESGEQDGVYSYNVLIPHKLIKNNFPSLVISVNAYDENFQNSSLHKLISEILSTFKFTL